MAPIAPLTLHTADKEENDAPAVEEDEEDTQDQHATHHRMGVQTLSAHRGGQQHERSLRGLPTATNGPRSRQGADAPGSGVRHRDGRGGRRQNLEVNKVKTLGENHSYCAESKQVTIADCRRDHKRTVL